MNQHKGIRIYVIPSMLKCWEGIFLHMVLDHVWKQYEKDKPKTKKFLCSPVSPEEATKAVTELNMRILDSKPLYVAQRRDGLNAERYHKNNKIE